MLQRAGVSAASAEFLLQRLRTKAALFVVDGSNRWPGVHHDHDALSSDWHSKGDLERRLP
jgi:hypothetical protein